MAGLLAPIKLLQLSDFRTGSTVLVNLLYGLFAPEQAVQTYDGVIEHLEPVLAQADIVKTHELLKIDAMRTAARAWGYQPYFVCSERRGRGLVFPPEFSRRPEVCVFDYAVLNETPQYALPQIVAHVAERLRKFLPEPAAQRMDPAAGLARLEAMNRRYAEIADEPFAYFDPFFHLHGHHRNRDARPDKDIFAGDCP